MAEHRQPSLHNSALSTLVHMRVSESSSLLLSPSQLQDTKAINLLCCKRVSALQKSITVEPRLQIWQIIGHNEEIFKMFFTNISMQQTYAYSKYQI